MFLLETHILKAKAKNNRQSLGFDEMIFVDCKGDNDGLCLLWK